MTGHGCHLEDWSRQTMTSGECGEVGDGAVWAASLISVARATAASSQDGSGMVLVGVPGGQADEEKQLACD